MSAVILFDGVCNFCNSSVNFVIKNDKQNYFKFAPLQSEIAEKLLDKHHINKEETDSVIVIEDEKAYTHSTAALRIAKNLGGIWSVAYIFIIVPKFIRDAVYKWIARNRYKWFGKKDVCMMPTPEIRQRFLE